MKSHLVLVSMFLLLMSASIVAKPLVVPLQLQNELIKKVIISQVFTGKNASLRINDDGTGCHFIKLSSPELKSVNRSLKLRARTKVKIGRPVNKNQCIFLVNWEGYLDLYHDVKISADGKKVKLHVSKSEILTLTKQKDQLGDAVWQAFKDQFYPKINSFNIDLGKHIDNLKLTLPFVVAQRNRAVVTKALESLAIKDIEIKKESVLVAIQGELPRLQVKSPKSAKQLSKSELALLESKLNAIDGFVTFTVKYFLQDKVPEHLKTALFDLMFNFRYETVKILENPVYSDPDPVRALFLSTWQGLSPIIRELALQKEDQTAALHLISFVTANDALASIDKYGAELGLDISVNGLRRLARLLNADPSIDPMLRDEKEDPLLRKFFGLTRELQKPRVELERIWLDYFLKSANAAVSLPSNLTKKLNNWVPKKHEIKSYLPMVRKVLSAVIQTQLKKKQLRKSHKKIFQDLVYAAAWQESCWKQFANIKGYRKPLKSYSGDLGIMQINPRVWRGFYDLHKLKWDIAYNANAGAEILMHYMTRYVIKNKEHIKTGRLENLARATYSGYNGGPSQYKRYRNGNVPNKIKRIDKAFYLKYKAVRDRGAMSVKSCYAGI